MSSEILTYQEVAEKIAADLRQQAQRLLEEADYVIEASCIERAESGVEIDGGECTVSLRLDGKKFDQLNDCDREFVRFLAYTLLRYESPKVAAVRKADADDAAKRNLAATEARRAA